MDWCWRSELYNSATQDPLQARRQAIDRGRILSGEVTVETFAVYDVVYSVHTKRVVAGG